MLVEAGKMAKTAGFKEKNIFVFDNGQVAEFDKSGGRLTDKRVPCDYILVDDTHIGEASSITLDDRRIMSEEGVMIIGVALDRKTGRLLREPDVVSRGFVYMKEARELISEIKRRISSVIEKYQKKPHDNNTDNGLRSILRDETTDFLYYKTKRRPMVITIINRI
jgi:ribonuclease J